MPDVSSHVVGIATVDQDKITDIAEFSNPISFRISQRFAGRLANNSQEMVANSHQLRRELAALLKKTKARAA